MLTWRTPSLDEWLDEHDAEGGLESTLRRLEVRAAKLRSPLQIHGELSMLDLGDALLLYKRGDGHRLFATHRSVNDASVLVFLAYRDHVSYDELNRDPAKRRSSLLALIDDDALSAHTASRSTPMEPPSMPPLPASRSRWVQRPASLKSLFTGDVLVAESFGWEDALRNADHETKLHVHALTVQAVATASHRANDDGTDPLDPSLDTEFLASDAEDVCIGFAVDRLVDGTTVVRLEGIQESRGSIDHVELNDNAPPERGDGTVDGLAQVSARVYPADRVGNQDAWLGRLGTKPALDPCLPLSDEELSILDRFSSGGSASIDPDRPGRRNELPLFLDGPAGSGKSTLLGFLAAGLIESKLRSPEVLEGELLFLTYSKRLADESRDRVAHILRFHFGRDPEQIAEVLRDSFMTTRDHFMNLLPDEFRSQFMPDRRVDFRSFREFMAARFPRDAPVDPELAWFVVRSFLKGFGTARHDDDGGDEARTSGQNRQGASYFSSSEFLALPPKRQDNVSPEDVAQIERQVLPRYLDWQSEHQRWDDQDLAIAALPFALIDAHHDEPRWMAVICDEAQDLTRAELRILVRTLGATNYDLQSRGPSVVLPMLFAADPGQTVNPSGFTWAGFGASFHDETELLLGASRAVGARVTHLKRNYRSDLVPIAVSDGIQAWRSTNLDFPTRATEPWSTQPGSVHRHLCDDHLDDEHRAQMETALREAIAVVVPCAEGDEGNYLAKDPFLRQVFRAELDRRETIGNVYSPMAAKGFEWDRVAPYGFGRRFAEVWHTDGRQSGHRGRPKETDFALNSLYVAATRARSSVHFFDPTDGDTGLWEHGLHDFVDHAPAIDRTGATLDDLRTSAKERRDGALQARLRGLDAENPDDLRRAASYFASTGDLQDEAKALLWAEFFEADVDDRQDLLPRFADLGEAGVLERHLWRQQNWRLLSSLPAIDDVDNRSTCRRLFARLLDGQTLTPDDLVSLAATIQALDRRVPSDRHGIEGQGRFVRATLELAVASPGGTPDLAPPAWASLSEACLLLHTNDLEAETDAIEAHVWCLARMGDEAAARQAAADLDLGDQERRRLEAQIVRTATGLWFADDDALLAAAESHASSSSDDQDQRDNHLVALALAALDDPGVRAQARTASSLPAHGGVASAVATTLLLDTLEHELDIARRLESLLHNEILPSPAQRTVSADRSDQP